MFTEAEKEELEQLGKITIEYITEEQFNRYKFLCKKWLDELLKEIKEREKING